MRLGERLGRHEVPRLRPSCPFLFTMNQHKSKRSNMVSGKFLFSRGAVVNLIVGSDEVETLVIPKSQVAFETNHTGVKRFVFAEKIIIKAFPGRTWDVILAAVSTGSPLQLELTNSRLDSAVITAEGSF